MQSVISAQQFSNNGAKEWKRVSTGRTQIGCHVEERLVLNRLQLVSRHISNCLLSNINVHKQRFLFFCKNDERFAKNHIDKVT